MLSIMLSTNLNPCVVVQVTVEEQNEREAADPRNNVSLTNAILSDVRHLDLHAHTHTLVAWVQRHPAQRNACHRHPAVFGLQHLACTLCHTRGMACTLCHARGMG